MRWDQRRDENEKAIHLALSMVAFVWRVERSVPAGVPDLLVMPTAGKYKGQYLLLEVKQPKGKLEGSQADFFARAREYGAKAFVVRSVDDALAVLR